MKRQWQIHCTTLWRPDARQRWVRAYQSILRWSLETDQPSDPSVNGKEDYHEDGGTRPGLESSRQVKLQTIDQQLERVNKHTHRRKDGSFRRRTSSATTATTAPRP
jgi:hypothetical protein